MEKESFVAAQKNGDGDLVSFKTSAGRTLSYPEALMEINKGAIEGVNTFKGKDGEMYIRSNPDHNKANNLDSLPPF
ncbi:DUF3892 domain-containing protein [Metabacillus idriensis]|uniref:DUF3892 domain-containing protein n=1 Tax=Metabacillus idriensis TaxID=324768 RepID=A0A6I2MFH6_9BACI|nr:DUF3892 domain-containing protein [Metabacillus idriensis]MCM3596851.1 DUF3892 domain-containing protein [Metabacillus idriensis]MRX55796.1 DUF3892 domain-containing protein [Metabacillus idriensis]OHR63375.1 hypothetical protein HMPREF3291_16700 [Bacillus sp. HMSC76G11]